jgi:hypothetical protein
MKTKAEVEAGHHRGAALDAGTQHQETTTVSVSAARRSCISERAGGTRGREDSEINNVASGVNF